MLHQRDNGAPKAQEIGDSERFVVLVKAHVLDDARPPIRMKISVLILSGKGCGSVPGSTNRAVAGELDSRDGGAWSADIDDLCLATWTVNRRSCGRAPWAPVEHGTSVEKLLNGSGNLLRGITRIVEGRLARRIQGVLFDQISEHEVLATPGCRVKRIGRIEIGNRLSRVPWRKAKAFVNRPAKVLASAGHDLERFPNIPTDIANVENSRLGICRVVTSSSGSESHS